MSNQTEEILTGADLGAAIAEEILGWKRAKLGVDYDGVNECEVLTRDGKLLGDGFQYPPKGKLHLGYHAPRYNGWGGFEEAVRLAQFVGLDLPISRMPTNGEELARLCLNHWRGKQAKEPRVLPHEQKPIRCRRCRWKGTWGECDQVPNTDGGKSLVCPRCNCRTFSPVCCSCRDVGVRVNEAALCERCVTGTRI